MTTDSFRPSFQSQDPAKEADTKNRNLLVSGHVRDFIPCCECNKPRCIYSATRLISDESCALKSIKEEQTYSCGSPVVSSDTSMP